MILGTLLIGCSLFGALDTAVYGRGDSATDTAGHKCNNIVVATFSGSPSDCDSTSHVKDTTNWQGLWVSTIYNDSDNHDVGVALMRFNIHPTYKRIVSAKLKLAIRTRPEDSMLVRVYGATTPWGVNDTVAGVNEVVASKGQANWWWSKAQTVRWADSSAGFSSADYSIPATSFKTKSTDTLHTRYIVDVYSIVRRWAAGLRNNGFVLVTDTVESPAFGAYSDFYSQTNDTLAFRPQLTVVYSSDRGVVRRRPTAFGFGF